MSLYLTTRLIRLTQIPVFIDEAIFIHLAQIIDSNWGNLFLTKLHAVQPLYVWIVAITQNFFKDPVLAGRLVSVAAGVVSLSGVYLIGRDFYSERVGQVSAVLYLFCPYFIFHERLALVDSLINALGVWVVWVSLDITKNNTLSKKSFFLLGVLLGLALFTKTRGLVLFPAPIIIFLVWKTYAKTNFLNYLGLITSIILLINLPYILSDQIVGYSDRNSFYSNSKSFIPLKILLNLPFDTWWYNIKMAMVYFLSYLTLPVILLATFGTFYAFAIKDKKGITLALISIIPFLIVLLIGNMIFARYYLAIVPPLIVLSGWSLVQLANFISEKIVVLKLSMPGTSLLILIIFVVLEGILFSINLTLNPSIVNIPKIERSGYLEPNPRSGYGVKEAAEFIISQGNKEPANVLTHWSQGNPQDGVMLYLWENPRINIVPALWWPQSKKLFPQTKTFPIYPSKYQTSATGVGRTESLKNVFFVRPVYTHLRKHFLKNNPEWKVIWRYSTPYRADHIEIYKLMNSANDSK